MNKVLKQETGASESCYYVIEHNSPLLGRLSPEFNSLEDARKWLKDARKWLKDNYQEGLRICEARFYI